MTQISCVVCKGPVEVRSAQGRKSGTPFVMMKCTQDGRHFRAFIPDKDFVEKVIMAASRTGTGWGTGTSPSTPQ